MKPVRELILKAQNLKVAFGGVQALNLDLFKLEENELRVIIGPNGAGKSTFMDLICGKTKADSGKVLFKNQEILGKPEVEIAQMGIGRKFQKPSVFAGLSVYDNLLLAYKMLKDVWSSIRFKINSEVVDRIHAVAKKVGLEDFLEVEAGGLSHGQKQWLEIGIVVIQNPKLMLIDEPAAGMSDTETAKTGDLILSLVEDHSVIVIEHDMNFVEQIAIEKVSVLVGGQLLTEGAFQDIRADERVINSYLGKVV